MSNKSVVILYISLACLTRCVSANEKIQQTHARVEVDSLEKVASPELHLHSGAVPEEEIEIIGGGSDAESGLVQLHNHNANEKTIPSSLFQTHEKILEPAISMHTVHAQGAEKHTVGEIHNPKHAPTQSSFAETTKLPNKYEPVTAREKIDQPPMRSAEAHEQTHNSNGMVDYNERFIRLHQGSTLPADLGIVKEQKGINGDFSFCFPSDATVVLSDASRKTMSSLAIGDTIRTASGFEMVTGFLHQQRFARSTFLSLSFKNGERFVASGDHRVYLADGTSMRLQEITVGDVMMDGRGGQQVVSDIDVVVKDGGYFAPLTRSGTILVDNVMASVFAGGPRGNFVDTLSRMATAPMHVLNQFVSRSLSTTVTQYLPHGGVVVS